MALLDDQGLHQTSARRRGVVVALVLVLVLVLPLMININSLIQLLKKVTLVVVVVVQLLLPVVVVVVQLMRCARAHVHSRFRRRLQGWIRLPWRRMTMCLKMMAKNNQA